MSGQWELTYTNAIRIIIILQGTVITQHIQLLYYIARFLLSLGQSRFALLLHYITYIHCAVYTVASMEVGSMYIYNYVIHPIVTYLASFGRLLSISILYKCF